MTSMKTGPHPEPVPPASQLAVLPFAAAVEGFLCGAQPRINLRLTVHRAINREGQQYLQQVCRYLGPRGAGGDPGTGRMLPVNFGIMGAAFESASVFRTRYYPTREEFLEKLLKDMLTTKRDPKKIDKEPLSWLAIPFLGNKGQPVLVLFADAGELNFFADDERVGAVVNMCWGFTRLVDSLEEKPFPNLRNFGFEAGEKVKGDATVYPTIQEPATQFPVPIFQRLESFNYETSVS